VDDSEENCAAAEELGIRSIHYRKGVTDLYGEIDRWIRAATLSTVTD
jgi:predicted translin family RNA/ssDNA-binding protein